jgi:hypothetical protein
VSTVVAILLALAILTLPAALVTVIARNWPDYDDQIPPDPPADAKVIHFTEARKRFVQAAAAPWDEAAAPLLRRHPPAAADRYLPVNPLYVLANAALDQQAAWRAERARSLSTPLLAAPVPAPVVVPLDEAPHLQPHAWEYPTDSFRALVLEEGAA